MTVDFDAIDMDRFKEMFDRIVLGKPPLADETKAETALRKQMQVEIAEIVAGGGIPSFPFD